jgi:hypothetical protein
MATLKVCKKYEKDDYGRIDPEFLRTWIIKNPDEPEITTDKGKDRKQ